MVLKFFIKYIYTLISNFKIILTNMLLQYIIPTLMFTRNIVRMVIYENKQPLPLISYNFKYIIFTTPIKYIIMQ